MPYVSESRHADMLNMQVDASEHAAELRSIATDIRNWEQDQASRLEEIADFLGRLAAVRLS